MSKIIVLDAGHGMGTLGKRCLKSIDPAQTREWFLNDRIADLVEETLKRDYDCTVLRVDDTTGAKDISLSARVKAANNAKADFYLSIHHNAGINGGAGGGTVVFYYNDAEMRAKAQRLYNAVTARTGLVGNRSSKVAVGDLYVIRYTTMPALLLENGFMDSTHDTPIILTAAHAKKTAQGIVDYLVKELGLSKNESVQDIPVPDKPQENRPYITVNKGDTLSGIGKKLGVAWKDIADLNGLTSPYTLHIGQKLRIPSKASAQPYYPAYTGKKTTLAGALTSLGISSSYSFRVKIAKANGITGYLGTAAQNTRMYNLLVAGLLKRV
jgi:N-acetylmuramoyl-L-alanine amidase